MMVDDPRVVVLAGGVGAARLLRGVIRACDPARVTAIVNTADDLNLHGLHISPDLDTVTYTLAEAINTETGWGLDGETWAAMGALERYGGITWFGLGDKDLATHLYRTQQLADGATLTEVTAAIAAAWELPLRVLPVSDDPVRTRVTVADEDEISFQEYFVERRHSVAVSAVRFDGAAEARPGPAVLDAIAAADCVIIAPSNPIVSIGPLLAIPGVRDALISRRAHTVAVSPIIDGAALKGPADRLMRELGHDATVVGVASLYRELAAMLAIDTADASLADDVVAAGMSALVTPTLMTDLEVAVELARTLIDTGLAGADSHPRTPA